MLPTAHHQHHPYHAPPLSLLHREHAAAPHTHKVHARSAGRRVDLGPAGPEPFEDASDNSFDVSSSIPGQVPANSSSNIASSIRDNTGTSGNKGDIAGSDPPNYKQEHIQGDVKHLSPSAMEVSPAPGTHTSNGKHTHSHSHRHGGGGGGAYGTSTVPSTVTSATTAPYYTAAGGVSGGVGGGFPRLRHLQWLWASLVWYWSTVVWVVTLPWRVLTWLTPGFLQPAVRWVEDTAAWWTGTPSRLAASATYGTISYVDRTISWLIQMVLGTHTANMHHFRVALEAYLRLVQHKAQLIEKHGFDGIWMAFNIKTV